MLRTKSLLLILLAALSVFIANAQTTPDPTDDVYTALITYEDINFSYDPSVFNHVAIVSIDDEAQTGEDVPAGALEVPHIQFRLHSGDDLPDSPWDHIGHVRVYRVEDVEANADYAAMLEELRVLLDERPALENYTTKPLGQDQPLPFLPIFPMGQILRAHASYLTTPTVYGVAYLTVYREDPGPVVSNELIHTFQGFSADGRYFVTGYFDAETELLPQHYPNVDLETFDMQAHLIEVSSALNEAAPESFRPGLNTVEEIFAFMSFE